MTAKKPNILILWGDDVGWWNISYNSRGQMGYRTPNIDRVANEGVAFTDYYAQQSCTAGRSAFITGQNPLRTGLTKVGMPGADLGRKIGKAVQPLRIFGGFGVVPKRRRQHRLPGGVGSD
jgi:arylsulfatase A-like enzyme